MISVISIEEKDKWDSIVKSFQEYDVYYLAGYSRAFQIHGDGEPMLFYYNDGNIRAINVAMKRDIAEDKNFGEKLAGDKYFDTATPYGYGGFLIEGMPNEARLMRLDDEYSALCRSKGIVCEFVRFHPLLRNHNVVKDIYAVSRLGNTVSINLESKVQIWDDLISKNRNMVRKAQKAGIVIYWGRSEELYKEFIEMYRKTMDRDNAKAYYYFQEDFYKSILDDLRHNALLFYAEYQSEIVAMSIILYANHQMHYHLSASDRNYNSLAPTNLLLFEAACWGCENEYRTFHLGGGLGGREDSLYKFKKAFNRNSDCSFWIGKKIFDETVYRELISITRNQDALTADTDFFPQYRASSV